MRAKSLQTIAECVRRFRTERGAGVVMVALDGHSASGKSTLAAALAERLDAAIVRGDDFYRDDPDAARRLLSPEEGVARYFDWERMRNEALVPLKQGLPAAFRPFDWVAGHGLTAPVTVEARGVVIVEGVYSTRPEFDGLVDLRVLVDTSADERRRRRRGRHDAHEWEQRWDAAERVYFATIRPRASFDLIVDGRA